MTQNNTVAAVANGSPKPRATLSSKAIAHANLRLELFYGFVALSVDQTRSADFGLGEILRPQVLIDRPQ